MYSAAVSTRLVVFPPTPISVLPHLLACCSQRIRFMTSIIFEATISCEFITPFFPQVRDPWQCVPCTAALWQQAGKLTAACALPCSAQYFLPLASIANVGKAIALAAFVSTTPAFQQALCNGGNLADLTAKNQVGGAGREQRSWQAGSEASSRFQQTMLHPADPACGCALLRRCFEV
jgi:hypothetical protein